jgi:hypothetical protein
MKVIYKYQVDLGTHEIEMPKGADILHADVMGVGKMFIWALVNPKHKLKKRKFTIFATGQEIDYDKKHYHYIKTMICDGYVWHLYEVLE